MVVPLLLTQPDLHTFIYYVTNMSLTVFLYNKELHDHGEPDDVDPDDDFRFDIIYR